MSLHITTVAHKSSTMDMRRTLLRARHNAAATREVDLVVYANTPVWLIDAVQACVVHNTRLTKQTSPAGDRRKPLWLLIPDVPATGVPRFMQSRQFRKWVDAATSARGRTRLFT